jgi:hypothetical protein
MKLKISQANLDNGVPADQHQCALAAAFCTLGFESVVVAENHRRRAVFWDPKEQGYKVVPLTDEAMQFVLDFDHREGLKEPLKPMEMELPDPRNATCTCADSDEADPEDCEIHGDIS